MSWSAGRYRRILVFGSSSRASAFFLHCQVRLDVAVRCVRTLVAEPERDNVERDPGLKKVHCGRVSAISAEI